MRNLQEEGERHWRYPQDNNFPSECLCLTYNLAIRVLWNEGMMREGPSIELVLSRWGFLRLPFQEFALNVWHEWVLYEYYLHAQ